VVATELGIPQYRVRPLKLRNPRRIPYVTLWCWDEEESEYTRYRCWLVLGCVFLLRFDTSEGNKSLY
jgi:hypothetical protein